MRETVGEFTANELKSKLYSAKYSILGGEYRKSGNPEFNQQIITITRFLNNLIDKKNIFAWRW